MEAEPSLPAKVPVYSYRYSMVMNGPSWRPWRMGTGEGAQGKRIFVSGTDLGLVLTWCQYAVCYQVNLFYASASSSVKRGE